MESVEIGFGGFQICCSTLYDWQNMIAILCGPLCGLLLVLVRHWIPKVSICSLILSIYNILPILPLDGGRALQILVKNKHVFRLIEIIIFIFMFLFGVYFCFILKLGMMPLVLILVLWIRYRKIPCKE